MPNEETIPAVTAPIIDQAATPETAPKTAQETAPEDAVLAAVTSDFTEAELAAMPDDVREDILAARGSSAAEPTPASEPTPTEQNPETPPAVSDSAPETPPPAAVQSPPDQGATTKSRDNSEAAVPSLDANALLSEELRAANARYATLQGKYNSEMAALRAKLAKYETPAAADPQPPADGDGNPADSAPSTPPATPDIREQDRALADKLGLDPEVVTSLREYFSEKMPGATAAGDNSASMTTMDERVSALEIQRLNADLDVRIRAATGGLTLDEVGNQSLFNYATTIVKNSEGVSAAKALADAHERFDNAAIANITADVVNAMKANGLWEDRPGHFAAPSAPKPAAAPAPGTVAKPASSAAPVVPHVSGVPAQPGQTRTADTVERELDAATRRVANGDASAIPLVDKLRDEYFKLTNNAS